MNADGNNLSADERRKLREQEAARKGAEIRDGLLRAHFKTGQERQAMKDLAFEHSLQALEKLVADGKLTPTKP